MRINNGLLWLSLAALSLRANAATIDFPTSLPLGNLGTTASEPNLTVTAWTVNKSNLGQWTATTINNRNDSVSDNGLGVCPVSGSCPASGNGNINEIDNNGSAFDVLRFQVASGYRLSGVGISSLDSGLKDGYAIFGSNSANPNFGTLTLLAQGNNQTAGAVVLNVALSGIYQYYYAAPQVRSTCSSNSDYLVKSVDVTTVPEPVSLGLCGAGLVAVGLLRRRSAR